jgi:hypothetical protein
MKKIILARHKSGGWSYRGLLITKHEWCLPITCTSYRLHFDGKVIEESDTLRGMREALADMEQEGWDQTLADLRK